MPSVGNELATLQLLPASDRLTELRCYDTPKHSEMTEIEPAKKQSRQITETSPCQPGFLAGSNNVSSKKTKIMNLEIGLTDFASKNN